MKDLDEKTLADTCMEEIRTLLEDHVGLPFIFDAMQAFTLMGLLQLILRHPKLEGFPREFADKLAHDLETRLGKGGPAIREMMRRGWFVEFDHEDRAGE